MISRRLFSTCAICTAIGGLAATSAQAQTAPAPTPGVTRTIIGKTDLPGDKYECVQVTAEIPAGGMVANHTHPGVESAYVLEGQGELTMVGMPGRVLKPSDWFSVPAGTVHGVRNIEKTMKLAITYTVEKGKPLASPATT